MRSAQARDFSPGREPEVDGWRQRRPITARKRTIVHLFCAIIIYTIYEVYKDVASSRSPSFLNAKAADDIKRSARGVSVTTS